MARKPNYRFERMERERTRAAKKAARAKAKADRAEQAKDEPATDAETEAAAGRRGVACERGAMHVAPIRVARVGCRRSSQAPSRSSKSSAGSITLLLLSQRDDIIDVISIMVVAGAWPSR